MFNALSGIGGGGQLNSNTSAQAGVALDAVSAIGNIFIGPVVTNILGPKYTLFIGGLPYILYAGSMLSYNYNANEGFVVASGAILGVGASLLWVAQGGIMAGYPLPSQQGRSVGIFWFIFKYVALDSWQTTA